MLSIHLSPSCAGLHSLDWSPQPIRHSPYGALIPSLTILCVGVRLCPFIVYFRLRINILYYQVLTLQCNIVLFYYFVYLLFTVLYTVAAPTTLHNTVIPSPPMLFLYNNIDIYAYTHISTLLTRLLTIE